MTKTRRIATAIALIAFCSGTQAQFSSAAPPTPNGITTPAGSGGYLGGSDDCNSAHPTLTGDVAGEPFCTATTGTTGQNESICFSFGSSGIANDVWYDWTATQDGVATLFTCGQTGIDTKAAVYPLSACPAAGTAIACNDDACGQQTSLDWPITSGTSYTIQLGTFPGAVGGCGTFSITSGSGLPYNRRILPEDITFEATDVPGSYMISGNSRFWDRSSPPVDLSVDVVLSIDGTPVDSVYIYQELPGPMGTGCGPNGCYSLPCTEVWGPDFGCSLCMCEKRTGWTLGPFGVAWGEVIRCELVAAPGSMPEISVGDDFAEVIFEPPHTPICFGDGSGAACGCGNESSPGSGSGCLNSCTLTSGGAGAILSSSGSASTTAANLTLVADRVRSIGLFFQAVNTIGGGTGVTFGDGIRCCGGSVARVSIESTGGTCPPTTAGTVTTTITTNSPTAGGTGLPLTSGITAGDKRCYQYWYRDPGAGNPCGASNFNLSNAVTVTWGA